MRHVVDHNTRDARWMTGQSIVRAQPPFGEDGQMLRMEIIRLNRSDVQHLASAQLVKRLLVMFREMACHQLIMSIRKKIGYH